MGLSAFQNSFLGGEIAPSLYGRLDDKLVAVGAAVLKNFVVQPSGSLKKRTGFQFISNLGTGRFRLIPFRFSSDQTLMLVFGNNTMQIVTQGKFVMDGGFPYILATPYSDSDIWELNYSQNADVVTLTSPNHAPQELRRYGATDWKFQEITTQPDIEPPQSVTAVATYPPTTGNDDDPLLSSEMRDVLTARYVVTAVNADGVESEASEVAITKCNYHLTGATVEVTWDAVPNALAYRVYRYVAGAYGFLAQTDQCTISDLGDTPDTSASPPHYREAFIGSESDGEIISISVVDGGSGYKSQESNDTESVIYISFLPTLYLEAADRTADSREIENKTLKAVVTFISPDGETYTGHINYNHGVDGGGSGSRETAWHACPSYEADKGFPITMDGPKPEVGADWTVKVKFTCEGNPWTLEPQSHNPSYGDAGSKAHFAFSTDTKISEYKKLWSDSGLPASKMVKNFAGNFETFPLIITGGSGAKANCTVVDGVVTSVQLLAGGSGYTTSSGITVDSPKGSGATFKVTIKSATPEEYPRCSGQFDQRRVFAGSYKNPLKVWFTAAGQQSLMTYHVPIQGDDRIEIVAVANDADMIRHIIGMESLILLTGSSEMRVIAVNGGALTPMSVGVRVQSYIGANAVKPVVSGNNIIYVAARGGHPRQIIYSESAGSYVSNDLGIRCPHFFDNKDIVDLTLAKAPIPMVWVVSNDGALYASTFVADQNINAWQQVDVGDKVESIGSVAEGTEDHVYIVVRRGDNAYLERMADIVIGSDIEARHMDSFLEGVFTSPQSHIIGLEHLEGRTVALHVDGKSQGTRVVRNGSVTLSTAGRVVAIGLPITATLVTIPFEYSNAAFIMRDRNLTKLYLKYIGSGDMEYSFYPVRPNEHPYQVDKTTSEINLQNERCKVAGLVMRATWELQGQVKLVSYDTGPLELLSFLCEMTVTRSTKTTTTTTTI